MAAVVRNLPVRRQGFLHKRSEHRILDVSRTRVDKRQRK